MWVCPILRVRPLAKAAPSGNLSSQPPQTPGIETVPPLRHALIACRRSLAKYSEVFAQLSQRDHSSSLQK